VTIVLTAEPVRRKGNTDVDNAALRADALVNEDIPKVINVWVIDRVLLEELAINHTKLALRGLILVFLGRDA
jgi:hypothetical protein